ncbi:hypothetical protein COCC4DRAFT_43981 [Bipolaris maydis ATCC 48331]|uniref:Uncharacterized protein n=3 Tax=Cochliobolus heterostrophus TaxID=5016 RepID=M2V5J2_COCH5|nr:uncharacterized protein COCC4DRAFT_43981 [Bipolaris maydis ATCC 48331]EMD95253.1 hypothetical protein COCHEDRAFT_1211215 [Bipolaris maydis C5]KAH7551163.1 hypothetical protein BM1_10037 [Bipolaris maydis]ENI00858.1 hypothetical protein COCC4DRAFT_43981 [Bipolaris maydis ATCC 48331]KAJ6191794.1 hypothetical protein J3E72DRAFT_389959 [Bipolaris maydis]KAJ6202918.1 hypothetical protein J3E72DRAFT_369605 [Bipolaris maydis]
MSNLVDDFIARRRADTRTVRSSRHQPSKARAPSLSSREPVVPSGTQQIKIEDRSYPVHDAGRIHQSVPLLVGSVTPNLPLLVETPPDKALTTNEAPTSDHTQLVLSGKLQHVANPAPPSIGHLYQQHQRDRMTISAPPVHGHIVQGVPNRLPQIKRRYVSLLAAIGMVMAFAWGSWLDNAGQNIVAKHANINVSIDRLERASETLNSCCRITPDCIAAVNALISQSAVLLDRDIRNAADAAVNLLGTAVLTPRGNTEAKHGLSCLHTGQLASQLREATQQCILVASRHNEALTHTRSASSQLQRTVRNIRAEREKLHVSRKNKHRRALEHAKELIGISSDFTYESTIEQYKDMADTIHTLDKAWNLTASSNNILHKEYVVWKGVGENLQDLVADLHAKIDVSKRMATCLGTRELREILQVVKGEMEKVVL